MLILFVTYGRKHDRQVVSARKAKMWQWGGCALYTGPRSRSGCHWSRATTPVSSTSSGSHHYLICVRRTPCATITPRPEPSIVVYSCWVRLFAMPCKWFCLFQFSLMNLFYILSIVLASPNQF